MEYTFSSPFSSIFVSEWVYHSAEVLVEFGVEIGKAALVLVHFMGPEKTSMWLSLALQATLRFRAKGSASSY